MTCAARISVVLLLLLPTLATAQDAPATQPRREVVAEVLGQPVYRDELPQPARALKGIDDYSSAISQRIIGPLAQGYRNEHKAALEPTEAELARAAAYFDQNAARSREEARPERERDLREIEARLAQPDLTPAERQKLEMRRNVLEQLTLSREAMKQRIAELETQLAALPPDDPGRLMLSMRKQGLEFELEPQGRMLAEMFVPGWKFQRHLYERFGGGRVLWQQGGIEAFDAMNAWIESEEKAGRLKFHDPHVREAVYLYWNVDHGPFLSDKPKQIEEFLNPPWLKEPAPTIQAAPSP